jgi:hypothetical protein
MAEEPLVAEKDRKYPESLRHLTDEITELILDNLDSNDEKMERLCDIQQQCIEEMNAIKSLMSSLSSEPDMTDIAESIVRTFDTSMRLTDNIMTKLRQVNEVLDEVEMRRRERSGNNKHVVDTIAAAESAT